MPRPVYIICSESGAEDRRSNLLSLFNVVERFVIARIPEAEGPTRFIPRQGLRVTSVWMREEDDTPDVEFEHQMVLLLPGVEAPVKTTVAGFRFEHTLHRFTMMTTTALPFAGPGLLRVQSKVRRAGAEQWATQEYPVIIDLAPDAREGEGDVPDEVEV